MAKEFDLIQQFFQPLSQGLQSDEVGIGDDGAVLNVPEGHQLVVVTDTLVSGVHFPEDTSAYDVAWKALAVNLSDLAAMGAEPGFFSLALTLPKSDELWLADFAKGLADLANKYRIPLIGGDTTKGPLTVTVTAQGWVPQKLSVLRSGAHRGDLVCVSDTIGDGAMGLKLALGEVDGFAKLLSAGEQEFLLQALNRPEPQLKLSALLRRYARSAIDISDGLLADLSHILERSNETTGEAIRLGAQINLQEVPLSDPVRQYLQATGDWQMILSGGDDYQLCFTVAREEFEELTELAAQSGIKLSKIGEIKSGEGIELLLNGEVLQLEKDLGYQHF